MSNFDKNDTFTKMTIKVPSLFQRIYSVWYRHIRVYARHLISNGLPPFLEPLFFLLAIGVGLGFYIEDMNGLSYISFLASGIIIPPAMYTAAFECSFGTFIRLEFEKIYDGMIASSITCKDLLLGEILFAGTKALFFSFSILIVITLFRLGSASAAFPSYPSALLAPLGGFFTGIMFASLSMIVTYFVKTINHFNFYFTGVLTPMFFFSGIVFPLSRLPRPLQIVAEFIPLTHSVRVVRAFCLNTYSVTLFYDWMYIILFSLVTTILAITLLSKRLVD
ncbi:MAG: ABC transporter permease [Spirochaetales bacterium]|nr:ABC transporter permease [Spirochaetales bacterium]